MCKSVKEQKTIERERERDRATGKNWKSESEEVSIILLTSDSNACGADVTRRWREVKKLSFIESLPL